MRIITHLSSNIFDIRYIFLHSLVDCSNQVPFHDRLLNGRADKERGFLEDFVTKGIKYVAKDFIDTVLALKGNNPEGILLVRENYSSTLACFAHQAFQTMRDVSTANYLE